MVPLIAQLMSSGLSLLGNALLSKGKVKLEEKLGVTLPSLDREVSNTELIRLRELEFEYEEQLISLVKDEAQHISSRWQVDMVSDSWLSKNVRPLVLVHLTLIITVMAFFSHWLNVSEPWIDLLATSYVTVIVAYFGSRGIEKVTLRGKK